MSEDPISVLKLPDRALSPEEPFRSDLAARLLSTQYATQPVSTINAPSLADTHLSRSSRRRLNPVWAAVPAALVVIVLVGLPGWLTGPTPPDTTSILFAPPFTVENGVYKFTVQMVNGEWLTMTLPESAGSQIEGFESGVSLGYSDSWAGLQVTSRYGGTEDLYRGMTPDETHEGGGGRPVHFYRNADDRGDLVFQFGPWSLVAPGGGGSGLDGTETTRARLASLINGHVTDEGFLVLTPTELNLLLPTHSVPNASFIRSDRSPVAWFWRLHPAECLSSEPEFTPESGITSLCDPETGDRLMLGSSTSFNSEDLGGISFVVTADRPR